MSVKVSSSFMLEGLSFQVYYKRDLESVTHCAFSLPFSLLIFGIEPIISTGSISKTGHGYKGEMSQPSGSREDSVKILQSNIT